MVTHHPEQHPAGNTYGLTQSECANIRFAAESSLWRYIFANPRFLGRDLIGIVLLGLLTGSRMAIPFIVAAVAVIRSYDWFCKRRLGVSLGYRR